MNPRIIAGAWKGRKLLTPAAVAALRANIAACKAGAMSRVVAADALRARDGAAHGLVFLDPPYGQDLLGKALAALGAQGWLAKDAVIVAELGPGDELALRDVFTERAHGKARLVFGRF